MIILPCLEFFITGGYVNYVFWLAFVFGLIVRLVRR